MRFTYYRYLAAYGRDPVDFDDMLDGLRVIGAMNGLDALKWGGDGG